eukprot:scaffold1484_cov16-Prasinocladus_malaysianus.AAC.1
MAHLLVEWLDDSNFKGYFMCDSTNVLDFSDYVGLCVISDLDISNPLDQPFGIVQIHMCDISSSAIRVFSSMWVATIWVARNHAFLTTAIRKHNSRYSSKFCRARAAAAAQQYTSSFSSIKQYSSKS